MYKRFITPGQVPKTGFLVTRPLLLGSKSKHFFLKVVMLRIKLKGLSIEHHASTYSVLTHILNLWFRLKGKKSECGHVAYQIKGKEV